MAISCRGVKVGLAGVAVAAGAVAGAVAGDVAVAAGADLPPPNAPIAVWQAEDSDELCCCRHVSAALPPGDTPEHCAMKSERQADLMALCCAAVGCWAVAASAKKPATQSVATRRLFLCLFWAWNIEPLPWNNPGTGCHTPRTYQVRYSYADRMRRSSAVDPRRFKLRFLRPASAHRHRYRRLPPDGRNGPRRRHVPHPC